jgi:NADH-quinone oxidoreductase subunit H
VCVALFFGGWHLPWIEWLIPSLQGDAAGGHPAVTTSLIACIVRSLIFFGKTMGIIFIFMWVRWSLPRFRFDQIMNLAWRALIPISLTLLMVTAIVVWWWGGDGRAYLRVGGRMALVLLVVNVLTLVVIMGVSRLLPAPPDTNRKIRVAGSRYETARVPSAGSVAVAQTSV